MPNDSVHRAAKSKAERRSLPLRCNWRLASWSTL